MLQTPRYWWITGSFTLSFPYNGSTVTTQLGNTGTAANLGALRTVPISTTNISAAVIQAALEALPNIGVGNVVVEQQTATNFVIRFVGALAGGKVPTLKVTSFLSSGNVIVSPTNGIVAVDDGGTWGGVAELPLPFP